MTVSPKETTAAFSAAVQQQPSSSCSLDRRCVGVTALTARREPWMNSLLHEPALASLLQQHGSPLNVVTADPMLANVRELDGVAKARSLDFRVFFARKANKCLTFVNAAPLAGSGIDVASLNELEQTLDAGIAASDIICTAAIKNAALVDVCIRNGITLTIDNEDELLLITHTAQNLAKPAAVAIRLSGFVHDDNKLKSRFGVDIEQCESFAKTIPSNHVRVTGLHFHLDGYCAHQRVSAITQSLAVVSQLRQQGHPIQFLDIGGGFPISYLHRGEQWEAFWTEHRCALLGQRSPLTYRNHGLGLIAVDGKIAGAPNSYPYYQTPTRSAWLAKILDSPVTGRTIADQIRDHALQLRCEPGRSILDGCGMTIARVEFRKQNAEGDWLIGLSMNRTQCRTSSDDFLVDPIVIASPEAAGEESREQNNAEPMEGFLVGAYCTESELISLRKLRFPAGIQRGDLVAFPNTAGYLMHFLESRSHQFPLAKNLVYDARSQTPWMLDKIDAE
ncbi:diaminopimelate decarboxylase [Rhodopirellula maiorica SM1]|uniref:Diaminopimelate decarboxylase n=1 Tax=Rhodopirellula maiorica SM1 TaxID=1265738 RepID=M5RGB9_9BACT|nr:Y4yA family PLP-dependent enzyme [Rhodopirellula maiorica]EMI18370.1 diaminopimelate decarboxylase [Rhodopirellula maiorica SM1]